MASTLPIMPSCAPEPGAWFTPLPISAGFATMLMLLSAHVEAERDLEHADLWDMALMGWLSEAEKTRLALVAALDALSGSEVRRVEDLPLKRMALLIRAVLESGDPAACLRLHRLPRLMPELFQATGRGQLAMRVNLLLDTTMVQFDALLALSDYTDGVSLEAEMTAPELSAVF